MGGLCESECKYVLSRPDFRETGMNIYQYPAAGARSGASGLRGFHPESTRAARSGLPRCRPSKMLTFTLFQHRKCVLIRITVVSMTKLLNEIFLTPANLFSLNFSRTGPLVFPRNASCGPASLHWPATSHTSSPRSATPACSVRFWSASPGSTDPLTARG